MSNISCLVIAGTHSGAGKTTIATALMAAFTRRGCTVQAFKTGPDFIDPTFHKAATGRPGHNLDGWMLSRDENLRIYSRQTGDAAMAIVEGVMGLFDGRSGMDDAGSAAEMAKWLDVPVVLVVDASAMARSAAAVVHGFETFDSAVNVAGVIFNRVAGVKHYQYLADAVRSRCAAIPLGYLPTEPEIALPERHLGLHLAEEVLTPKMLDRLAAWIEQTVDIGRIIRLAAKPPEESPRPAVLKPSASHCEPDRVCIGVARDRAFAFYYEENLTRLRERGAELVEFSPLADSVIPGRLGGLYIGGGYPELHAEALANNVGMLNSIRRFAASGAPIYAECGGFMYLTEAIVDVAGHSHAMAGIFPVTVRMQTRLAALGYVEVEQLQTVGWLQAGERIRGHEFRYSSADPMPAAIPRLYRTHSQRETTLEGYLKGSVLGSYIHFHFGSCPEFAARFVESCKQYSNRETTARSAGLSQ